MCPAVRPFDQDGPGEDFFLISSLLFSIFSLVAILVGSRDHRTQFWKGAIQGSFHKSLVAIDPVDDQNSKIYIPCNLEVNLITHLGVIALFSSNL
jgi:hypothetical protein